jgi:hypothetical protein
LHDILVRLRGNNKKIRHLVRERRLQERRLETKADATEDARRMFVMISLQQLAYHEDNKADNKVNIANANDLEHQMILALEAPKHMMKLEFVIV